MTYKRLILSVAVISVMDSDKVNPENGFDVAHQNGMHKQLPDAEENGGAFYNTNEITDKPTESDISALVGDLEDATLEDLVTEDNPSIELPKVMISLHICCPIFYLLSGSCLFLC